MRRTGKRKQIALAVAACFVASSALANPTGPTVVNGTASIVQNGKLLTITNSPNAIINWQSFSIGANEVTRFIQQSQSSAVLNRVTGAGGVIDPSVILGALQSNGRVFLINPSGILFGAGAQVDVAGLVATSLNLSNADFLANRLRFTEVAGAGSVVNQGNITTGTGGNVYLVGAAVTNSGIITSPQGEVILAAGNSVELVSPGTPNLRVEISAPDNEARNLGQIVVDSGRAGIYAGLINQSGAIRANGAVAEGGKILLKATKNAILEAGSVTTANGASGGTVTVQSGDTTLVSGSVEAKGASGQGGSVQVLGNLVGVIGTASLDASSDTGGGSVLVGGDFQGKNAEVQNAFRTYVGPDATIKADAIISGDGGKVIVWSDDTTRFYGNISARGGSQSGNGGLVEVSGKELLDFNGRVNVGAPAGRSGTILLDPRDIIIQDNAGPQDAQVADSSVLFSDGGGAADFTISDEALEGLTGNVVLQAQRDIIVQNGLSGGLNFANQTAGERVVFQAGENIRIGSPLTTAGAAIHLEADSPHTRATAGIVPNGEGNIRIDTGANVTSNGGAITLIAGRSVNKGGFQLGADVNAGNGGINVSITNDESAGAPGAPSDFIMGATGSSHLANNEVSRLQAGAAGTLTLGEATTAGDNGLGGGTARLLTVNSIMQDTSTATNVPAASGGALRLVAGSGGISLARNLGTFQTTEFNTGGSLNLSAALNTNNNPLTITALGGINIAGGSITTGTGLFTCSSPSGCPSTSVVVNSWNVDASGDWTVGANWLLGVPTAGQVVLIDRPSGNYTITLGSAGQGAALTEGVGLLVNNESLNLVGNASFKTTLNIGSSLVYGGTTASSNTGTMTLTNSVLGGSGRLANEGTFQLTNSSVGAGFSNRAALATLTANATNAFTSGLTVLDGTVNIASGTTVVSGTGLVQSGGAATVASGATLSSSIYDLSGTGSIGGTGSIAVTTDFNRTGGTFGSNFANIDLSRVGNFAVGGFAATNSVRLRSSTGGITLNGVVSAGGAGDAIVIVGNTFTNQVGATALSAPGGRWLVYSTSPAGSTENGLTAMADPAAPRLYGRSYGANPPATIAEPGSHLIYSAQPSLTITADNKSKIYGGVDPALTYTLSGFVNDDGFLDTALTAGLSGAATLSAATGSAATAGTHIISASQGSLASGSGYTFATPVNGTLSVSKATLTVTADDKSKIYGATDPALTFTANAGQLFYGDTGAVVSGLSLTAPTGAAATAGTHTITASGGTAANYNITTANGTLTVGQASLTATADNKSKTYGAADPTLTYTVGGTLFYGDTASVVSGVSLTAPTGAAATAGTHIITASGGTAANYAVTMANGTLTVGQAALTATADNKSKTYGAADPALTYTVGGTLFYGDTAAVVSGVSLAAPTGAAATAGTHTITASGGTAANYAVTTANGTLTVGKASLTATADNKSKTYGAADPALTYTVGGTLYYGDTATVVSGVSLAAPTGAAATAGTHTITASGGTAANYNITTANGALTVGKAALTVTADDKSKTYGASDPALTYTANAAQLFYGDTATVVSGVSLAAPTGAAATAGTHTIAASGGTAANYNITTANGTLTVGKAALTVTADDKSKIYGATDPALTFTANAGQLFYGDTAAVVSGVSLAAPTGAAATAGTHTIAASGGTAANYNITTANGALTVGKAALTVTADDKSKTYGASDPALTYTANAAQLFYGDTATVVSGVSLAAPTGAAATAGTHTIAASGGTAANYNITTANGTLTVGKAALTVAADSKAKVYGDADPALTYLANGFQYSDSAGSVLTGGLTRAVGETVAGGPYAINQGTLAANGNYTVSYSPNTLSITPATLTYLANTSSREYGDANPAFTGSVTGFKLADTLGTATTGTLSFTSLALPSSNVGSYAINGGGLTANSGNYTFVQDPANAAALTINPATLTYLANAASRERGDSNPVLGGTVTGFKLGQNIGTATAGTLAFSSPAAPSAAEGQYAINGSGLTALNGNYTFVQAPANTTALTVTPPVNFTWTSAGGGAWESGSNWNKGFAPVDGAVVTIPDVGPAGPSATITYSSATTNLKTLTSSEGLTLAGGNLNLGTGGADASAFLGGAPVALTGGMLGINAGATLAVTDLTLNGGTLHGAGAIIGNVSNLAGTVAAGSSIGTLTINGNYVQGPAGTLGVEVGGANQYDVLNVTGNVTLDGTLAVTLLNNFMPPLNETYTVIQSGGAVSGSLGVSSAQSAPAFRTAYLPSSLNLIAGASAVVPPLLTPIVDGGQILVALTDLSVTSQSETSMSLEDKKKEEKEKSEMQKKHSCTGAAVVSDAGGVAVFGGGGSRCTSRGCF